MLQWKFANHAYATVHAEHKKGLLAFALSLLITSLNPLPAASAGEVRVSYAVYLYEDKSEASGEVTCEAENYCRIEINREFGIKVLRHKDTVEVRITSPGDVMFSNYDNLLRLTNDEGKTFSGGVLHKIMLYNGRPSSGYLYQRDLRYRLKNNEYAMVEIIVK